MGALSMRERIEQKRAGIAAQRSKGLRPYKFKSGETKFRILPAADPEQDWWRDYGMHFLKSWDGQKKFAIGDKSITYGDHDPIREMLFDAMRQAPDEDTKKAYRDMLASDRVIFNALILSDPDQSAKEPVLIDMSLTAFDGVLAQFETWLEEDPDADLAGLKTGHVFKVEKTGQGLDTRYVYTATPKVAPLKPAILEKAHDLDAWLKALFEEKEQKALQFLGQINSAVGISTTVAGQLTHQTDENTGVSSNTVTNLSDDDDDDEAETVEDAEYEETETDEDPAGDDDSPFEDTDDDGDEEEVEEEVKPAKKQTTKKAAPKKNKPADDDDEIEDILAMLDD